MMLMILLYTILRIGVHTFKSKNGPKLRELWCFKVALPPPPYGCKNWQYYYTLWMCIHTKKKFFQVVRIKKIWWEWNQLVNSVILHCSQLRSLFLLFMTRRLWSWQHLRVWIYNGLDMLRDVIGDAVKQMGEDLVFSQWM